MEFQSDGNLVVYEGRGAGSLGNGNFGNQRSAASNSGRWKPGDLQPARGLPLWQSYTNYPAEYNIAGGELALVAPQILHSQNRKLEMLPDCDLVLYSFENGQMGGVVWHSDTSGLGLDCSADFQADGNFVVYDASGSALWESGTSGTTGGVLSLQADGNLVVYNGAGEPLWAAGSNFPEEFIWSADQFSLATGEWVQSRNRKLIMQEDCNLVLLNVENAIVGGPLWSSGTAGIGSDCELRLQADGNPRRL